MTLPRSLRVGRSRTGLGLFATKAFRRGQRIIRIAGRVVSYEVLWARQGRFADNCFRFGPETYLDPGDGAGAYLNHSCEPNACIRKSRNQLFLVASDRIGRNREIVIDYSTIIGDDDVWTMRCDCCRRICRHRIRRFGSLPLALQQRYADREMVPKYILATLTRPA